MSAQATEATQISISRALAGRSRFFAFSAGVLLLIVFIGFARSFFLRPLFDAPSLPPSLYIHGTVLTTWFVLFFVQALLIGRGHVRTHRRLGIAAAIFACAVVISGILANDRRLSALQSAGEPDNIILWGNYVTLLMFAAFVSAAVLLRRRPEAHKRLLLLASIVIIGPALGRIPTWPLFAAGLDAAHNFAIGGLLLLLGSLMAHDLLARRKLHPATWIGAVAILISLGASVALGLSATGFALLRSFA